MTTLTNEDGIFRLADLEDGTWTLHVEMRGFVAIDRDVAVPFTESPLVFALKMQPYDEIVGGTASAGASSPRAAPPVTPPPDEPDIINGSLTNAAATPFAQPRAIGNNRPSFGRPYAGSLASNLANSALNARPYSFGGPAVPADTSNVQLGFDLRGPFRIPWLIQNGPTMSLGFNYGVNSNATSQSTFMPTAAERAGDFSQSATIIRDPLTDLPFTDNTIPADRISRQAIALLAYYPLPNTTTMGATFQRAIATETRQGSARFQTWYALTPRDRIQGNVSGRRSVTESVNLFDFTDTGRQSSFDANLSWTHTFSSRLQMTSRYQFMRSVATLAPFFANRIDVSADAGIAGNDRRPGNWGPPAIAFPTIADLDDGEDQRTVTSMHALGLSFMWSRGGHNMTFGGDVNRTAFDQAAQPDARGTLSFTGAATGNALADFLLGIPTTSAMAFGTTRTVLRGATFDAYFRDDFRVAPGLTLNAGVRWEYESPFTEREGRLVNFDVAPGFAAVRPVLASDPTGSPTGRRYPASLLGADRSGIEPRIAASWRPWPTSSLRRSRGIRPVSKPRHVPVAGAASRTAAAVREDVQHPEHAGDAVDARESLSGLSAGELEHLCDRPGLSRRLFAFLAGDRAERSCRRR